MHWEQPYLDLVRRVWDTGDERRDRTGVGTRALFGATLRFDLSDGRVPLLTTKRVAWKVAARELLWFLSGATNIRPLVEQGVHIWTDWPLARFRRETGEAIDRDGFEARILANEAFAAEWGDLGPVYGKQWIDWPRYVAADVPGLYARAGGHNQVAALVAGLRTNPASRRHVLTAWNVDELDRMALPPCHMTYQFAVAGGQLSCMLWQRSCDLGLGFAFNVFEASLLTAMLARQCDLVPGELVWSGGDVHLYLNHAGLVAEQLARTPAGEPRLRLTRRADTIFDHVIGDVAVDDYHPQAHIPAPVAV